MPEQITNEPIRSLSTDELRRRLDQLEQLKQKSTQGRQIQDAPQFQPQSGQVQAPPQQQQAPARPLSLTEDTPLKNLATDPMEGALQQMNPKARQFVMENAILDRINQQPVSGETPEEEGDRFPFGAVAGGTIGSLLMAPTAPSGPTGMIAGGGAGSMAGEAFQQLFEHATDDPRAPETTRQALEQMGTEGMLGAAGEGLGQGLTKTTRELFKVFRPFASSADEVKLNAFKEVGVTPLPFEVTQRTFLGRVQKWAEQGFIGSGIMRRFNEKRVKILRQFEDQLLQKTSPVAQNYKQLGEFTKQNLNFLSDELEATAKQDFIASSRLMGTSKIVSTDNVKQAAQGILNEEELLKDVPGLQFGQIKKIANGILKLEDKITFEQARAFQKRLGAKLSQLKNIPEGEVKRLFAGIANDIDNIPNPEGLEALTRAKSMWRELANLDEIKAFAKIDRNDEPIKLMRQLFQQGNTTSIEQVRRLIGKENWPLYQRAFIKDLLTRGNLENLEHTLQKQTLESLQAALDPAQIKALDDMATVSKAMRTTAIEEGLRTAPGLTLLNMTQGGIGINLLSSQTAGVGIPFISNFPVSQGLLFLSPAIVAKILTNPVGAKWLSAGFRIGPDHPAAQVALNRLMELGVGTAIRSKLAQEEVRIDLKDVIQNKKENKSGSAFQTEKEFKKFLGQGK